jgi:hypothetical protein
MSLTGITAQTIFIDEKEKQFFEYVYDIVLKDKYYYFISESFEEYYFIMIDTIEYYEKLEQYEKFSIFKKNID